MRFPTLAAIAALGLTAACNDADDYDRNDAAADQSAAAGYSTDGSADAAASAAQSASASAAAAADAARDAANTRTVIVPGDRDDDDVTVQVGPDGARVNATVDTN